MRLRLVAFYAVLVSGPALAQSDKNKAAVTDAMPYPIPETPALTYLGVTSAKVNRPSSVKSLTSALVSGIDANGRVQQGLAFEIAPFTLLGHSTLREYQTTWGFVKSNLKVSIGTVRAAGDSASTNGAIGMRAVLFDDGDPLARRSFTDSIALAMARCAPSGPAPPESYSREQTLQCLTTATAPLVNSFAKRHWNRTSLALAAAIGSRFEESDIRKGASNGAAAWANYSHELGTYGQSLLAAAINHHRAQTADSTYTAASGGARFLLGSARMNGFAEGVIEARWNTGSTVRKNQGTWSLGIEFLASDNTWISTGFGNRYRAIGQPDRVVIFAGIQWGISEKARMMPDA